MSTEEHKHASEMLAKLQAHHRARAEELSSACEIQRECTRQKLAETLAAASGSFPIVILPEESEHS